MLKSSKALAAEEGGNDAAPKSYDVVVVGSGGAGLAAAIQAHDEGASVLIVEKMPTIGGNTIKASAGMNAAETRFQRVKGIKDSKELFYQETLKGGHNKTTRSCCAVSLKTRRKPLSGWRTGALCSTTLPPPVG